MIKSSHTVKLAFYARLALILHAVFLLLILLYLGRTIFIPLFFSLLIAILLHPLAAYFERKGIPRGFACAIPMILFVAVLGGLIFFFSTELGSFSKELPHLKQRFTGLIQNGSDWIAHKYNIDDSKQKDYLNKSSHDLIAFGISTMGSTFRGVLELFVITIFCLLFSFFTLYHRALLHRFVFSFFPPTHAGKIRNVVKNIQDVINHYVLGLFVEMGLIILLSFTALTLFGIKYALLFALLAAVLNLIPYFGIYTAAAVSMLVIFAQGTSNQALEAGIVFIVIHIIDSNIFLPAIVGGRVKMNPFITLIAIFVGKLFWGIPGMFLFIPLAAVLRIVSESIKEFRPWAILLGEESRR